MTYLEFKRLGLPVGYKNSFRWSLFEDVKRDREFNIPLHERVIDLRAPLNMENGVYSVYYCDLEKIVEGITIEDGYYIIGPTIEAINLAVRMGLSGRKGETTLPTDIIHHVYIEGLFYEKFNKAFKVSMGS